MTEAVLDTPATPQIPSITKVLVPLLAPVQAQAEATFNLARIEALQLLERFGRSGAVKDIRARMDIMALTPEAKATERSETVSMIEAAATPQLRQVGRPVFERLERSAGRCNMMQDECIDSLQALLFRWHGELSEKTKDAKPEQLVALMAELKRELNATINDTLAPLSEPRTMKPRGQEQTFSSALGRHEPRAELISVVGELQRVNPEEAQGIVKRFTTEVSATTRETLGISQPSAALA